MAVTAVPVSASLVRLPKASYPKTLGCQGVLVDRDQLVGPVVDVRPGVGADGPRAPVAVAVVGVAARLGEAGSLPPFRHMRPRWSRFAADEGTKIELRTYLGRNSSSKCRCRRGAH
jgi:hypothetical protein